MLEDAVKSQGNYEMAARFRKHNVQGIGRRFLRSLAILRVFR